MTRVEARETIQQMVRENRKVEIESTLGPDKPVDYLKYEDGSFYYVFSHKGSSEKLTLEEVIEIFKGICYLETLGCDRCELLYFEQCIY